MVLQSLHVSPKPLLNHRDLCDIDSGTVSALVGLDILAPATTLSNHARCRQCSEECVLNVDIIRDQAGDIVHVLGHCPDPGEDSSLIRFGIEDLKTWHVEPSALARQACKWLGLGAMPVDIAHSHCWRLGQVKAAGISYRVFFAVGCGCPNTPARILKSIGTAIQACPPSVLLLPSIIESQIDIPDGTPVVSLVSLLNVSDDGLCLDIDALRAQIESWVAGEEVQAMPGFIFSPDYRVVWRLDKMYSLTAPQAEIIKMLHKAWVDKYRFLHVSSLTQNLSQEKIHDVFKGKLPEMRELLISDGQGNYALRLPGEE